MYVAKLSFSQRSFHHRIVTRSPNHMCAISCRIISARLLALGLGHLRAGDHPLAVVTQPTFSIAPN